MGVRSAVGGWMQRAGQRLAARDPAGAGFTYQDGGLDRPWHMDRAIGSTWTPPAGRLIWELAPARAMSRDLAEGSAHLRAALEWFRCHVTGSGHTRLTWPRVGREDAARLKPVMDWLRDEWIAHQDLPYGARDETIPVLGQQVLTTMLRDGDCFGIPYREESRNGTMERRRLQVYPGDSLAEVETSVTPDTGRDGQHRAMGITYSTRGRPLVYHFGYGGRVQPAGWGGYASETDQTPFPAARVWHFFDDARVDPATLRSMPWATPALDPIARLDEYDRAFIRAAKQRAAIALALAKDAGKTVPAVGGRAFGSASASASDGRRPKRYQVASEHAGDVYEIEDGYTTVNTFPGSPNAQEAIHVARMEMRICGALGISIATLFGDYKGQNFSSSQQGTLQERERVKRLQRLMVRRFYLRVWYGFFADRWPEMLMRFPALRPEDEWRLKAVLLQLASYVALEKHRVIPPILNAWLQGALTYAEMRGEIGQTTDDVESILAQIAEERAAMGLPPLGDAAKDAVPDGDEDDDDEDDGDEEKDNA